MGNARVARTSGHLSGLEFRSNTAEPICLSSRFVHVDRFRFVHDSRVKVCRSCVRQANYKSRWNTFPSVSGLASEPIQQVLLSLEFVGGHTPMFKLQQVAHLRLIVPVPETYIGSIVKGTSAVFHVPAAPGRSYSAKVARIPDALNQQSRAMMVELDVYNKDGSLAPGMYPTVDWPVGAGRVFFLVPSTGVVTTTERSLVIT